jgi:hypothetical protein
VLTRKRGSSRRRIRNKPINGGRKYDQIFSDAVASQLRRERKEGERVERLGLPML